jgi:Holliday junction resolvase-like predicted endonuclease
MYKRSLGYEAEELVKQHYIVGWRTYIVSNFTIRWWEIDLIFANTDTILFIEVKCINSLDSIHEYITVKKRLAMKKTIATYRVRNKEKRSPRIDVVFVKNGTIYTIIENCTDF